MGFSILQLNIILLVLPVDFNSWNEQCVPEMFLIRSSYTR